MTDFYMLVTTVFLNFHTPYIFKGHKVGWFQCLIFSYFLFLFCFVVAIFDLVHDVEAVFHLP